MAPEYGATVGFFPPDEQSVRYLEATGRPPDLVAAFAAYHRAQGLLRVPRPGEVDYSEVVELDLGSVRPSVAGPKRPQDRIDLPALGATFRDLLSRGDAAGYGRSPEERSRRFRYQPGSGGAEAGTGRVARVRAPDGELELGHGDVVIAAITSCTNTSNPGVMLAAGLVARKARARGLAPRPWGKTSLSPGSRVVSRYLERTGLQADLDALGFQTTGYGCMTCIGNSGPLDDRIERLLSDHDLVVASVLSGNRNFEARVHPSVKANFLMSPPLVVAFALAGRVDIDLEREPLGTGSDGRAVFLRDVWPALAEVEALRAVAADPAAYRANYGEGAGGGGRWDDLPVRGGKLYAWDPASTYVQEPPYFADFPPTPGEPGDVTGARALAIFGDSVTTDHISPAGSIEPTSPAGRYLRSLGVGVADFNSYGSRRGNHHVMVRGTFANVRLRNLMVPGVEGGVTVHQPSGRRLAIPDAAEEYGRAGVPLCILAGQEYGSGSSRDWAAKGPALLGVRFVVARSYERIHRSNLVGMGILPCQFPEGVSARTLGLDGSESYDLAGVSGRISPRQGARLVVTRAGGRREEVPVIVRIDTLYEAEVHRHGGILPYVLRQIV
jgi:aconitate hydratase